MNQYVLSPLSRGDWKLPTDVSIMESLIFYNGKFLMASKEFSVNGEKINIPDSVPTDAVYLIEINDKTEKKITRKRAIDV